MRASPLLALKLRITNLPATEEIHTLTLRCQVQIEPAKRRYLPQEQEKLLDLFGTPERWSRTVRPLLWMNTTVAVPGFTGNVLVDLELPCTFDFNVAATKYFHALNAGDIPVCVMFSGTVFYRGQNDALQVAQVPWDREANFRLPVSVWKEMMEMHFRPIPHGCVCSVTYSSNSTNIRFATVFRPGNRPSAERWTR